LLKKSLTIQNKASRKKQRQFVAFCEQNKSGWMIITVNGVKGCIKGAAWNTWNEHVKWRQPQALSSGTVY